MQPENTGSFGKQEKIHFYISRFDIFNESFVSSGKQEHL